MTAAISAAATIRMPSRASVSAPAPLALGPSAEPCAPAFGQRGGTEGIRRFGGLPLIGGSDWRRYGHDSAQLAGGGPLRA